MAPAGDQAKRGGRLGDSLVMSDRPRRAMRLFARTFAAWLLDRQGLIDGDIFQVLDSAAGPDHLDLVGSGIFTQTEDERRLVANCVTGSAR